MLARTLPLFLFASTLASQTLVKDIGTTPATGVGSSDPSGFVALPGGDLLFAATTTPPRADLLRTDGTTAGTASVVDVAAGQAPGHVEQLTPLPSGRVVFVARSEGVGREPWVSDGTAAGTILLADVRVGDEGSDAGGLVAAGDHVYFHADDGVHGPELWRTDGTPSGTHLVVDLVPGFAGSQDAGAELSLAQLPGGDVIFTARTGTQRELWRTDGTAPGTTIVAAPGSLAIHDLAELTSLAGGVLLRVDLGPAGDRLWRTDGTPAGTLELAGGMLEGILVDGATAYFVGVDAQGDAELWSTDGSLAGTAKVVDLTPASPGLATTHLVGVHGGEVYFAAADDGLDLDLYRSDGTAAGTSFVSEVVPLHEPASLSGLGLDLGSALVFRGVLGGVTSLWRTDGSAQGTYALPVDTTDWSAAGVSAGRAAFPSEVGGLGREPWITDGTVAGTDLVANLFPDPLTEGAAELEILGALRDVAFLRVDDGTHGAEPWISDGTDAGTQLLVDATPGSGSSGPLSFASNGSIAVLCDPWTAPPNDPWISDGTPQGTVLLPVSAAVPDFHARAVHAFGDRFLLAASTPGGGIEPWITDGTVAGTFLLADVAPGPAHSSPRNFTTWRGKVYFTATSPTTGREPWVTDGTPAGTMQLAEVVPGPDNSRGFEFHGVGDRVVFSNDGALFADPDNEPWSTDGTPAGTARLLDVWQGPEGSNPFGYQQVGARLLFLAFPSYVVGARPFLTDGTSAGTVALPTLPNSATSTLRIDDDTSLLVSLHDTWVVDGVQLLGPYPPLDRFYPGGVAHVEPYAFAPIADDVAVCTLNSAAHGQELFVARGTSADPELLFDLAPASSNPSGLTRIGTTVLFVADDGVHGRELFSFPLALLGDETVASFGHGCAGTGGVVPTLDVLGEADASATQPFALVVEDVLPGTALFLAWSRSTTAAPFPGCTLFVGGNLRLILGGADPAGRGAFLVPPSPGLAGVRFVAQAFALDPMGAAFGVLSATAGLEVVVGP